MDTLFALEQLEEAEAQKKVQKKRPKRIPTTFVSSGARKTRPRSLPTPKDQATLDVPGTAHSGGERSPSVGADSRRISFAETPRPGARRLWIPTKTDALSSGFVYDARLNKYNVTEEEWNHFSSDIIEIAQIPGPAIMWSLQKKKVIQRMKKEIQYDGDLKRKLKQWNKLFRRQGFQAWLELPTGKGEKDQSDEIIGGTQEDIDKAKRDAKRFRIVVSQDASDRPASVYSRSSSLNRSVSGEGRAAKSDALASDELERDLNALKLEQERGSRDG